MKKQFVINKVGIRKSHAKARGMAKWHLIRRRRCAASGIRLQLDRHCPVGS